MRRTEFKRSTPMPAPKHWGVTPPGRLQAVEDVADVIPLRRPARRAPIKPVSAKRARENRERAAMADRLYPDRREGTVLCSVPGCGPADDLHEVKTRGRGGSITDEDNVKPLCRQHNDDLSQKPESELQWAYKLGLLRHSWNDPDGGSAA